jgi:DNA replication protein DnaC
VRSPLRTNQVAAGGPCPYGECDGSGIIVDVEAYASQPCRCRPQRIARAKARKLSAVIPKRYRGASFDRPPVTQIEPTVVAAVRRYVSEIDANLDAGRGLWLMGDVGTGKTTLAMIVSRTAIEQGRTVAIYSMPRLLSELRTTFDADAETSYLGLLDSLASIDLLHLDDVGAERTSDWVLEQLYSIVNARYEDERAMVITTNKSYEELKEQIGERTVSRLVEMCGDPLPLFGSDRRVAHDVPGAPAMDGPHGQGADAPWSPPEPGGLNYGEPPPGQWPPSEDDIRVVRGPWPGGRPPGGA